MATKSDIRVVQSDITTMMQSMSNQTLEMKQMLQALNSKIDEKNASVQSDAPNLVEGAFKTEAMQKAPEMPSEKAPQTAHFTSPIMQDSHERMTFPHRQPLPPDASRGWLRNYANGDQEQEQDRSNRFDRGRDRSRSRSQGFASYANERPITPYPTNAPPAPNPKPTHLQSTAIIKQEAFRPSEIGYFYPGLPEDTHTTRDYIVSGKDVFYRDVHMFVQQVKRVTAIKDTKGQLHLCLRESAMIWFTSQSEYVQQRLSQPEEFCMTLIAKYKISTSKAFDKLQAEHYTMQDARKGRPADDYIQAIIRHGRSCDIVDFAALTYAWKNLDNELRRDVKRPTKHTNSDEFVEALEDVIEYYGSITPRKDDRTFTVASDRAFTTNRFDEKEAAFQRGVKAAERRLLSQQSSNPPPPPTREYPGNTQRQYPPPPPPNQKLLTNQTETRPTYFTNTQDTYTADDEAYYPSPTNTKYATAADAQFGETMAIFHDQAPLEEHFNDTHTARHNMPPLSCNICQVTYLEDYKGLDNHMFDCHQIDIRSSQSKARKQYVNWMEHAALNVYEIKAPPNGYATFKAKLFQNDDNQKHIAVCADTGSGTSFMDESLLPKGNLYGQLDTVPPVTVRGIAGEKIVDKRMHLPIHVVGADGIILQARPYVTKGIKAGIILGNDVLGVPSNKISLHLHSMQMQIGRIHVPIEFTSPKASPVSFHITSITASTALKSCFKTIGSKTAKTVKFAMGIGQGKHVPTTKIDALSQPSPTLPMRQMALHQLSDYQMLRFAGPVTQKISFRFAPEIDSKNISEMPLETPEWRRHAAPLAGHPHRLRHTKTLASCRRRLDQSWR